MKRPQDGGKPALTLHEEIEVLRRLLHMARRSQCGAIYCDDSKLSIGTGPRALGETIWCSWSDAKKLAESWIDRKPMERAVVASTKRVEQPHGSQSRKRA